MRIDKEAIKRELIERAGAVSDSIKIRHAKDDFDELLPGIIENLIRMRAGHDSKIKKELLDYLQPAIDDLIRWHNSR